MRITTIYVETPEGDEERDLPTRWEICGCCNGNGTSSRYLGAITQSDREPGGDWEDPDEFEAYMAGEYDRRCDECEGSGKVRVVDVEHLSAEDLAAYEAACDEERDYQACLAAERRMGC